MASAIWHSSTKKDKKRLNFTIFSLACFFRLVLACQNTIKAIDKQIEEYLKVETSFYKQLRFYVFFLLIRDDGLVHIGY